MMPDEIIRTENLCFEYPSKRALSDVCLSVPAHTVTALVGPNGAGKTTLMRCLAALERPFSGEVLVDGFDSEESAQEIHSRIGYLPDSFGVYETLSVRQCLVYAARSRFLPEKTLKARVEEAAAMLGITGYLQAGAGTLSRGLRQRLAIAQSIIHKPRLLILDEPASGLDPDARKSLADLITGLAGGGITILVSSHILSELQDYCTDVIILSEGRVISHQKISPALPEGMVWMEAEFDRITEDAKNFIRSHSGAEIEAWENMVRFPFTRDKNSHAMLLRNIIKNGFNVTSFREERASIHEIYAKARRDDAVKS